MSQLKTPEQMKAYLNQELQEIQLAISRLNKVIEQTDSKAAKKEFQEAYKELLTQVQFLEESLENYGETSEASEQ